MRYKILAILLLLFCVTVSFTQKDASGLYGICENHLYACSQIYLRPDHTFKYGVFMDVGGWKFWEGNWNQNNDTITLNSYEQPEANSNIFSNNYSIEGTFIKCSFDSTEIKNVVIQINDSSLIDTLQFDESWLIPPNFHVKSISVTDLSNKDAGLTFFFGTHNSLEIHTLKSESRSDILLEKIITDQKWLLVGNKLFYKRNLDGSYQDFYYKKTNLNKNTFPLNSR